MPVLLPGLGVDGVSRLEREHLAAAAPDPTLALNDMQVLPARVAVPMGPTAWLEPHQQRAAWRVLNQDEIVAASGQREVLRVGLGEGDVGRPSTPHAITPAATDPIRAVTSCMAVVAAIRRGLKTATPSCERSSSSTPSVPSVIDPR